MPRSGVGVSGRLSSLYQDLGQGSVHLDSRTLQVDCEQPGPTTRLGTNSGPCANWHKKVRNLSSSISAPRAGIGIHVASTHIPTCQLVEINLPESRPPYLFFPTSKTFGLALTFLADLLLYIRAKKDQEAPLDMLEWRKSFHIISCVSIFIVSEVLARMATISYNPKLNVQIGKKNHQHGPVIEEIEGLIKVYKDGYVERFPIVPNVSCTVVPELGVVCRDVIIDKFNNTWARFYVPRCQGKLPLLVYFHGGGFCVGSASWMCYHEFLAKLATKAGCVIMSVNYRLAPENRLPAAYDDGCNAIMWVKQETVNGSVEQRWWWSQCNFSKVFLAGDSAGANIAHNVASRLGSLVSADQCTSPKQFCIKGTILIQPFFGGEARTHSERFMAQPSTSALTLNASDAYWRLSLPTGANRDNPWCNPLSTNLAALRLPPTLVCISEMDILRDRNLELCTAMARAGKRVEQVVYQGVGHAFQILNNSPVSQNRTHEMISHIKAFMNQ